MKSLVFLPMTLFLSTNVFAADLNILGTVSASAGSPTRTLIQSDAAQAIYDQMSLKPVYIGEDATNGAYEKAGTSITCYQYMHGKKITGYTCEMKIDSQGNASPGI